MSHSRDAVTVTPLYERGLSCHLSHDVSPAVSDTCHKDGEELVVVWSAALYRRGEAPGLSSYAQRGANISLSREVVEDERSL